MNLDNLNEQQLNEVFDAAGKYPIANLTPKAKIPHMIGIAVEGKENLVVRFCNYAAKGDAVKQVKPGDKFMQVQIMQMSDKGNLQVLKGGLGPDPIGAMNSICDVTLETMKFAHSDACLIRFPIKQLQGQAKTLSRIAERIVNKRGKGTFQYVPGMAKFENKYMYILIARKAKQLANIQGLGIDPELYEIVPVAVGDVVVDKKTGEKVTKVEAVEGSLAAKENKRTERSALSGAKISRRDFLRSVRELNLHDFNDKKEIQGDKFENPDNITAIQGKTSAEIKSIGTLINSPLNNSSDLDGIHMVDAEIVKKYPVINANNIASFAGDMRAMLEAKHATLSDISMSVDAYVNTNMQNIMRGVYEKQHKKISNIITFADEYNANAYTLSEKRAIKNYTGSYYEDMNNVFIFNEQPGSHVQMWINDLDSAFKSGGVKIPEGMSLYRGMKVKTNLAKISLDNKMFYFTNFVSCSMAPNIFGSGIGGNIAASHVIANNKDIPLTQAATFFGFAIHTVNVPAIITGNLSHHSEENEVILPRGTVFKFTNVSVSERVMEDPNFSWRNQSLVWAECEAVSGSQLDESEIVYDGDHLFETGELKPAEGFSKFLKREVENESARKISKANSGREILSTLLSDDGMSPKFYN